MKLLRKKTNKTISKSKEIIKKEKQKIKSEKKKIKLEKQKKFYRTKPGKIIKRLFNMGESYQPLSIKSQIFSMLYFVILGFIICLLVLFVLSGGKNYLKIYYDLNKLINVYDTINSNYYQNFDKEKLIDEAISSMLESIGDDYTNYQNEQSTTSFLENIQGSYEGIGCMVSMNENNEIYVVSVFDDSPAQKAGIQINDIITAIDGTDYTNKSSEDMSNYIKKQTESTIKITIKRQEETKELELIRNKVEIPSVTSEVINQDNTKIGYIYISIFSTVSYEQFKEQLEKLEKKKIEGLIIDVRNNTGGYLGTVTDITSLFLEKGKTIYQLQSSKKTEKIKDTTKESRNYPIAILVNGSSASASEILASAIKESYNGLVVGTNTYGKGTVQKTKKLSDGSMIKYTTQKWLTPKGNWINETGVEPTNPVELTNTEEDNQKTTAISLITQKIKNAK